jgi:DNA-binding SARP family transcriptional activator/ATP/maltotriose-dependent transcriptional regulator MalT
VSQLPRYHLPRPRLTDALRQGSVGLIVGGGGYGKSLLADEFSDVLGIPTITAVLDQTEVSADLLLVRLRTAAMQLGLSDVAARMDHVGHDDPSTRLDVLFDALEAQPTLIVVDELQNAAPDAVELLVAAANRLQESQRLLLIGRHAPAGLEALAGADSSVSLGTADLALTDAELGDLCGDRFGLALTSDQLTDLRDATDGWLAAVIMYAARSGADDASEPDSTLAEASAHSGPAVLSALVEDILRRLPAEHRAGLAQVAHLPFLDDDLVAAATGIDGLLIAARSAGLPLSNAPGRWSVLIGPVRDLLMASAPADVDTLVRGAHAYAARGEVAMAADVLISSDQSDAAAELLSGLTPHEAEQLELTEFASLAERLPESAIAKHPRLLLHLVRACEPGAVTRLRTAVLEQATRLVDSQTDPLLSRELGAELGRDLIWAEQQDEAEALANQLLSQTGLGEDLTRARLLEVLGWAATFQKDDVHLGYAEERLAIAARTYRAHELWSWLAHLMLPLGMWVYVSRGAFDDALKCLDDALALVPHQRNQRALILTFRAEVLDALGRYDESADNLVEAEALAATGHDPRLPAYIAWDRARAASQQGDIDTTLACIEMVEATSTDWFDQSGCLFLSDAANFLDRLGLTERAAEYLARAQAFRPRDEPALSRAEATILARSGDPDDAERALQTLLGSPWCEPRETWYITLMRARAAMRRGDSDAARLAGEAFTQAARLGYPQLPLVQERQIAEELLALAASNGRLTALDLDVGAFPVVVSMLGRFEVSQGGRLLDIPAGQGRQLLKLIASAGGTMLVDQVVEHLWPEIDEEVGANRLRTVLNRLRESAGDLVIRDERALRLAPHVHTDARRFEEDARRAQALAAARSPEALSVARSALAIYRGDLLPDDAYDAWATMPRERLRRHALSLLDLCADAAAGVGDLDEAVRCLVRATDIAPYEEERYLAAARHLLTQGRRGAARSYVDRARAVLDELNLSEPAALIDLDRLVRRM